jgi:hypothetical protein
MGKTVTPTIIEQLTESLDERTVNYRTPELNGRSRKAKQKGLYAISRTFTVVISEKKFLLSEL